MIGDPKKGTVRIESLLLALSTTTQALQAALTGWRAAEEGRANYRTRWRRERKLRRRAETEIETLKADAARDKWLVPDDRRCPHCGEWAMIFDGRDLTCPGCGKSPRDL
jgi:hypothetical protein